MPSHDDKNMDNMKAGMRAVWRASMLEDPSTLTPLAAGDDIVNKTFSSAVQIAFDIKDKTIMKQLVGRDMLWRPTSRDGGPPAIPFANYYAAVASEDTCERQAVQSTVSYLFQSRETYYNEPYDFSDKEKASRAQHLEHIFVTYGDAKTYVERLAFMLGRDPQEYGWIVETIDAARARAARARDRLLPPVIGVASSSSSSSTAVMST